MDAFFFSIFIYRSFRFGLGKLILQILWIQILRARQVFLCQIRFCQYLHVLGVGNLLILWDKSAMSIILIISNLSYFCSRFVFLFSKRQTVSNENNSPQLIFRKSNSTVQLVRWKMGGSLSTVSIVRWIAFHRCTTIGWRAFLNTKQSGLQIFRK